MDFPHTGVPCCFIIGSIPDDAFAAARGLNESTPELLIDAVFALVMELGRRGTKRRVNPKRIELTRPAEQENRFEEYFGCPVKYRTTRDVLVLRAADLELPFVTHNDELLHMLAPQLEQKLKEGRIVSRFGLSHEKQTHARSGDSPSALRVGL